MRVARLWENVAIYRWLSLSKPAPFDKLRVRGSQVSHSLDTCQRTFGGKVGGIKKGRSIVIALGQRNFAETLLRQRQHHLDAAVAAAAFLRIVRGNGKIFAKAHGLNAIRRDVHIGDEILLHRDGPFR